MSSIRSSRNVSAAPKEKDGPSRYYLYAFDFDHTVVDSNSDTAITDIIDHSIPGHIKSIYDGTNWTVFMNHIFVYLASQGVSVENLAERIKELKLMTGMDGLLHRIAEAVLEKPRSHFIIVSDANDFFINACLINLTPPVVPNAVISNNAEFTHQPSFFQIHPFEEQYACSICPKNLCKGRALKKYVEEKGPFTKVYYAGDGGNDLCPAQHLSQADTLFVREGYKLSKIIRHGSYKGVQVQISAQIVYFDNGNTILENIVF